MAIRQGPCLDARSDQCDILILVSNLAAAYQTVDHVDKGKNPDARSLIRNRGSHAARSGAARQSQPLTRLFDGAMTQRWKPSRPRQRVPGPA